MNLNYLKYFISVQKILIKSQFHQIIVSQAIINLFIIIIIAIIIVIEF